MATLELFLDMSALFRNGVEAIENGIEDFATKSPKRLSSAIRNVTAGVLLILKEKLRQLSSNQGGVLLAKKVRLTTDSAGKVIPEWDGDQTVDTEQVRERLTDMKVALPRWKEVQALVRIRNHVEHHVPRATSEQAQDAIANATAFLEEFLRLELEVRPEELFSPGVWSSMLEIGRLNAQVRDDCRRSKVDVQFASSAAAEFVKESMRCSACGSDLLFLTSDDFDNARAECRSCGISDSAPDFLASALAQHFGNHDDKDAGPQLACCEQCGTTNFVVEEDHCFACGEGRTYGECIRCGNSIAAEEQELGGLCSWCAHMSSKQD